METEYLRRHVDDFLDGALQHLPALMLTGPRACGKTTTAARRTHSIVRADDPAQTALLEANPQGYLTELDPPVLIDEWQAVPETLAAVKRIVDSRIGPGHFLVTGSVRARIQLNPWPGTGRITPLPMYGLTQSEIQGSRTASSFVDRLFDGDLPTGVLNDVPSIFEYVQQAAAGGFPEAVKLPEEYRDSWYEGYVHMVAGRDVADIAAIEYPELMKRVLRAAALNTAGLPQLQTIATAVNSTRVTVERYLDLLEELGLVDRVPAWASNRFKRMVKTSKLHVTDTGLTLWLAGLDSSALLRNTDMLGRVMDSFVLAQLRPLFRLNRRKVTAYHLRDANGRREIDLILESQQGDFVAIEVKAAGKVTRKDVRHLEWLRDEHPQEFTRGVILHSGEAAGEISEDIWSLPIGSIWA